VTPGESTTVFSSSTRQTPAHRNRTVNTLDRPNRSARFEVHQSVQTEFSRAVELLEQYEACPFGDATITAPLEREGIEYLYSFDDDFDVLDGVTLLKTVNDPVT
jgi:hypothetical protein